MTDVFYVVIDWYLTTGMCGREGWAMYALNPWHCRITRAGVDDFSNNRKTQCSVDLLQLKEHDKSMFPKTPCQVSVRPLITRVPVSLWSPELSSQLSGSLSFWVTGSVWISWVWLCAQQGNRHPRPPGATTKWETCTQEIDDFIKVRWDNDCQAVLPFSGF